MLLERRPEHRARASRAKLAMLGQARSKVDRAWPTCVTQIRPGPDGLQTRHATLFGRTWLCFDQFRPHSIELGQVWAEFSHVGLGPTVFGRAWPEAVRECAKFGRTRVGFVRGVARWIRAGCRS